MNYAYASQALNYAGNLSLNDGRFAFIMFDLDLDLAGNNKKNLSLTWGSDPENSTRKAFQSALLISVNNNVSEEYLAFADDVKKRSPGPPFYSPVNPGYTVSVWCHDMLRHDQVMWIRDGLYKSIKHRITEIYF